MIQGFIFPHVASGESEPAAAIYIGTLPPSHKPTSKSFHACFALQFHLPSPAPPPPPPLLDRRSRDCCSFTPLATQIPVMDEDAEAIMAALATLPPRRFSDLTVALSSDLRLHQQRLFLLLLSPAHFALVLGHVRALSFSQKVALVARLLLRSLARLARAWGDRNDMAAPAVGGIRELDAGLLLLFMCEAYDPDSPHTWASDADWRAGVSARAREDLLSPAGLGACGWEATVCRHVDLVARCRQLLAAVPDCDWGTAAVSRGRKAGRDAAASAAAVVALPSVQRPGAECVVCREVIEAGRDACAMPCGHAFHWGCILPWLRKKNTCPCCRFELPTDDVFCEAERLWRVVVGKAKYAY